MQKIKLILFLARPAFIIFTTGWMELISRQRCCLGGIRNAQEREIERKYGPKVKSISVFFIFDMERQVCENKSSDPDPVLVS